MTSRCGAGKIRGTPRPSPASRSRRPSASRTARTSDCAGSWTPGPHSGSGRSPTPTARPRPPSTSGSRRARQLLGREPEARKNSRGMTTLGAATQLGGPERRRGTEPRLRRRGQRRRRSSTSHPWLKVCETVAEQQGFFHWELDFATVFARGGFDLQLGNPPWVRPRTDVDALLAEGDPWWQLALKPSEAARNAKRDATLALPGIRDLVIERDSGRRRDGGVPWFRAGVSAAGRTAARPLPMLHGTDVEAFISRRNRHSHPS